MGCEINLHINYKLFYGGGNEKNFETYSEEKKKKNINKTIDVRYIK